MGNCTRCGSPIDYTSAFCMCDRCQRNADLPRHQRAEIARLRAELQDEREAHAATVKERDALEAKLGRAVELLDLFVTLIEDDEEAQDVGTDLWATVFRSKEYLADQPAVAGEGEGSDESTKIIG